MKETYMRVLGVKNFFGINILFSLPTFEGGERSSDDLVAWPRAKAEHPWRLRSMIGWRDSKVTDATHC